MHTNPPNPEHIFPVGSHPGGLYLPLTAGPAIMERSEFDRLMEAVPDSGIFVEVGTWSGALAAHMADRHPKATILSVDNFSFAPECYHLWAANRRPNMQLFVGDSSNFFRAFAFQAAGILVDCDHEEAAVYADLQAAAGHVATGAPLLAHDYGSPVWPGVQRAVDRFCSDHGWKIANRTNTLVELRK